LLGLAWSSQCPANQEYLPEVQFGCPASCDQPIPLCEAAIGPGCGCRAGKVLAGSTRPSRPDRCIPPRRCRKPTTAPLCPNGSPLKDPTTGQQLFCGRGGEPCPQGSTCNTDPLDRFAVCCPDLEQKPPTDSCIVSGCNGEICANEGRFSICLAPTCEQSCLSLTTCQSDGNGLCAWNADVQQYQQCLANCK
jgi:Lustrin, cysteine-rich repeated domain